MSSNRMTSLASLVTSVPEIPMDTPMSASLMAGASLTPSPVIATTWPCFLNARTIRSLWLGDTRANTVVSSTTRANSSSSMRSSWAPVNT